MIQVQPAVVVTWTPTAVGYNEHAYRRFSNGGDDTRQVGVEARCRRRFFRRVVELAALAHEVVVRVDDQQGRFIDGVGMCHCNLLIMMRTSTAGDVSVPCESLRTRSRLRACGYARA